MIFKLDLNQSVNMFSVLKVCGGRGHPCRNVLISLVNFSLHFPVTSDSRNVSVWEETKLSEFKKQKELSVPLPTKVY
jgi:hypothetical protein